MSTTAIRDLRAVPPLPEPAAPAPAPAPAPARRPLSAVAGTSLTLVGLLLLAFVAHVALLGGLVHQRDQATAYDDLRLALASGTAPVGPTDVDGVPLALGAPVALLDVPELGLREVVLEGTTSGVTQSGVGHRRDTPLPGQVGTSVLVGRKAGFGGPFRDLTGLSVDDVITVTTGQGEQRFEVTSIRRSGQPAPVVPPGAAALTLVTALGSAFAPSGLVLVDALATTPVQPRPATAFPPGSLPVAERALEGEPAAAYPLVLWCQALLLAALGYTWARVRWGRRQAWLVGVPVLTVLSLVVADTASRLLPNVL